MCHRVRFREHREIWAAVDDFVHRLNFGDSATPPVDTMWIVDVELKLDPVPFPRLFQAYRIDACLMADCSGIYIDEKAFYEFETNRWQERRLRFSLAHELGHLFLHRDEIRGNRFQSIDEFRRWAGNLADHASAEYQADEFAGRLLVPVDMLTDVYDRECRKLDDIDENWRDVEDARAGVAKQIAGHFGVNAQVIETRFAREGLWPIS